MAQSPYIVQVVVSKETFDALNELTARTAAQFPSMTVSRSSVARDCLLRGLPLVTAMLPKAKR